MNEVPKISEADTKQMSAADVVMEYRLVKGAIDRPRTADFHGWAASFEDRLQSRLNQLQIRLADEFVKQSEPLGDLENE